MACGYQYTQNALPAPAACTICAWKFTLIIITAPPVLNKALLCLGTKVASQSISGSTVSACEEMEQHSTFQYNPNFSQNFIICTLSESVKRYLVPALLLGSTFNQEISIYWASLISYRELCIADMKTSGVPLSMLLISWREEINTNYLFWFLSWDSHITYQKL